MNTKKVYAILAAYRNNNGDTCPVFSVSVCKVKKENSAITGKSFRNLGKQYAKIVFQAVV